MKIRWINKICIWNTMSFPEHSQVIEGESLKVNNHDIIWKWHTCSKEHIYPKCELHLVYQWKLRRFKLLEDKQIDNDMNPIIYSRHIKTLLKNSYNQVTHKHLIFFFRIPISLPYTHQRKHVFHERLQAYTPLDPATVEFPCWNTSEHNLMIPCHHVGSVQYLKSKIKIYLTYKGQSSC